MGAPDVSRTTPPMALAAGWASTVAGSHTASSAAFKKADPYMTHLGRVTGMRPQVVHACVHDIPVGEFRGSIQPIDLVQVREECGNSSCRASLTSRSSAAYMRNDTQHRRDGPDG